MTRKSAEELLETAYSVQSPDEHIEFYRDFAKIYDQDFAERLSYQTPKLLAQFYHHISIQSDRPIADIGCGTGLGAAALGLGADAVHGFDISADMLELACKKELYSELHEINLKSDLGAFSHRYGCLFSVGTFTLGHLGPQDLRHCLKMLRPNGLVCITVSHAHFEATGFEKELRILLEDGAIHSLQVETVDIFDVDEGSHAKDQAYLLAFRLN